MSIGHCQPFWLASRGPDGAGRGLYAALHEAATARPAIGVVCVPPLLHEQPRSRRFVAEAASALAALGLPCLRFDFHGSGDSTGPGDALDFASMRADLDAAVAALQARTGVARVALLGWRAAALPIAAWLRGGAHADLVALWEPIAEGGAWLAGLEEMDARERASRPRPRPGVPRTADPHDGQLMGFAAPPALRRDLAAARLDDGWPRSVPLWTVVRDAAAPGHAARSWPLPDGAPTFAGGAGMEATLFLSPALERVVGDIGRALLEPAAFGRARVTA